MNSLQTSGSWNANLYEDHHAFVWQYGESLLDLLAPQAGERILDLGCGTGQLTEKIANRGARVVGIDHSADMVMKAKQNYPSLSFEVADARNFQVEQPFDAVFSNAALHWIKEPDAVIRCIQQALKPGGRFIAELGGRGNVAAIVAALEAITSDSLNPNAFIHPWYFPSLSEYTTRLEQQGLEVTLAVLFDRPTPLEGETGIANWLQMFAGNLLSGLSPQERAATIQAIEEQLRPTLYRDGRWFADYRRLRVAATKI